MTGAADHFDTCEPGPFPVTPVVDRDAFPFDGLQPAHYRAIMLDPPWKFSGGKKGRPQHYARMTDAEIGAMPIAKLAHPEGAHIFVWITSPIDGPRFWNGVFPGWKRQGIRYSGRMFVWVKTLRSTSRGGDLLFYHRNSFHSGTGFTSRKNCEDCLVFKTGKPQRLRRNIREEIIAPVREHSRKPDEAYARIEQFCAGPYADVFARQRRPAWDAYGNEPDKFSRSAA